MHCCAHKVVYFNSVTAQKSTLVFKTKSPKLETISRRPSKQSWISGPTLHPAVQALVSSLLVHGHLLHDLETGRLLVGSQKYLAVFMNVADFLKGIEKLLQKNCQNRARTFNEEKRLQRTQAFTG